MKSVKYNNIENVFNMLNKNQNLIKLVDSVGRTPLHFAVRWGFSLIVEILLFYNADIHANDELRVTPFKLGENLDNDDVYHLLLEA